MSTYFIVKAGIHFAAHGHQSSAWVNAPFSITGVKCSSCKHTWSHGHRFIPYECPPELRRLLRSNRSPLGVTDHRKLVVECRRIMHSTGKELDDVKPGVSFLPSFNAVWHYHPVDFLRAQGGSAIVSQRVADLFQEMDWTGAEFFPATVVRLGGEPDFARVNGLLREQADDFGSIARALSGSIVHEPYYHLVVVGESRWIWPLLSKCEVCGFRDYVPSGFAMSENQWLGHDIFRVLPTSRIAVTERVKHCFEELKFEGIQFRRMDHV